MSTLISDPARWIAAEATGLGFDSVGFADARSPWAASDHLWQHLAAGHHAEMTWMQTTAVRRQHPTDLWPEARSAIVLGISYAPAHDPLTALAHKDTGVISAYAQGDDYHDLIKPRLKQLASQIAAQTGAEVKVFVDTAPLMEKPLAARAGVGWQGKHTVVVSRTQGSWLFLGVILTTLDLPPSEPARDHCGSCRRCLDVCPTDAFPAPYQLDSRKCLAYLSNEHPGQIPRAYRAAMGNRIYGCDDCVAVCPWNRFARATAEVRLMARPELQSPDLQALSRLDDVGFRQMFRKNPVKRLKRDRFVRNVVIALGNSSDPDVLPAVVARLTDDSALVRGAAVWAAQQLADADQIAALRARHEATEPDAEVRAEWDQINPA